MNDDVLWDEYFINIAHAVSLKSKDPNTKIGSVITGPDREIRATGFNGFPRGFPDTKENWQRPEKYKWVIHSEDNGLINAARVGVSTKGCCIYLNTTPYSICSNCALKIRNAGIIKAYGPKYSLLKGNWKESCKDALTVFENAVELIEIDIDPR